MLTFRQKTFWYALAVSYSALVVFAALSFPWWGHLSFMSEEVSYLIIAFFSTTLFIILISWILQRWLLKPIKQLQAKISKEINISNNVCIDFDILGEFEGLSLSVEASINEIKKQMQAFNEYRERLNSALMTNTQQVVFNWDKEHDQWYFDDNLKNLLGYSKNEFPQSKLMYEKLVHPEDVSLLEQTFLEILFSPDEPVEIIQRMRHKNGEWKWVLMRARVIPASHQHKSFQIAGTLQDFTRQKQAQEELYKLKHYDQLTNLLNREYFVTKIDTLIEKSRSTQKVFAVVAVGLDNFRMINNSYGPLLGDKLLQEVADRLRACTEDKDKLARLSSDEFGLLVEQTTDLKNFLQKLLGILAATFVVETQTILMGASIGVSIFPQDALLANDLYRHATTALSHAKRFRRNSYRFYLPEMNNRLQSRQQMEFLLRRALMNNEFKLVYQPRVDTRTQRICGIEALLRWHNPELGVIMPEEFISIAEESGMIVPLGPWILRTACEQIKYLHEQGFTDLKVSVNLSGTEFLSGEMVEQVTRILEEVKVSPFALDLELTESVLMENAERCTLILKVFKAMGISIAIDDFGTGYSSLSYLRRFPIDSLKIDKMFVDNLHNPDDASIVKAIIEMAKSLKLKLVAEGVETKTQLDYLVAMGVTEIQGFYFYKPMYPDELLEKLKLQNAD